jgi:hydroxypyruvate isomerase
MNAPISRRSVLSNLAAGTAAAAAAAWGRQALSAAEPATPQEGPACRPLKGRINHSICRGCYGRIPLDKLCQSARAMGIKSIELIGPQEWPIVRKHGLVCAMGSGPGINIPDGFNRLENHDPLVALYEALLPQAAAAGVPNVICLSGNRRGLDDQQGMKNCAVGLKRLMPLAEKLKVNVVMEGLNSKVDHGDYMYDHTAWGVELCKLVGSERFKLLYDIYHMQIMEGDLIATIRKFAPYIAHYHTGGVPGRHEIDQTQEIYYPAVMKAIADTGYRGFVAQEFMPTRPDPLVSLRQAIQICDVD